MFSRSACWGTEGTGYFTSTVQWDKVNWWCGSWGARIIMIVLYYFHDYLVQTETNILNNSEAKDSKDMWCPSALDKLKTTFKDMKVNKQWQFTHLLDILSL